MIKKLMKSIAFKKALEFGVKKYKQRGSKKYSS